MSARGLTFRESMAALYRDPRPCRNNGGHNRRDDDTALVHEQINAGATLTALAAERGITPQTLGKRLRKYRARNGLDGRAPYPGNRDRR